jgi:hypothetical protein
VRDRGPLARLGEAQHVHPRGGSRLGDPGDRLAQRRRSRVAVDDEQRVRAVVRGRGGRHRGLRGGRPGRPERPVLQAPYDLRGARLGLFAVEGEQQPAVLAVRGAQVRQPVEPGPLLGAALRRARAVRAQQHDLERGGRVQRAQLGERRAGEPGQARAGSGERQGRRARRAQVHGEGDGREPPGAVLGRQIGGAQPYGQRVGVRGAALPQPASRAQCGQQHGRRVGPPLAQRLGLEGVALLGAAPGAGEPPARPGAYRADAAGAAAGLGAGPGPLAGLAPAAGPEPGRAVAVAVNAAATAVRTGVRGALLRGGGAPAGRLRGVGAG